MAITEECIKDCEIVEKDLFVDISKINRNGTEIN